VGLVALFNLVMMAQSLLGYVFLAIVVSLVGQPIKGFFMRILKFKNTLATVVTLLVLLLLILGLDQWLCR
jgi:predicted PurR-regulated permease PerM